MGFKDFLGNYKWSKDKSVDEEIVNAIIKEEDYKSNEGEEFLFTSPSVRYDFPYMAGMQGFFCVTNKRIFLWKGKWQDLQEMSVPNINEIDTTSMTRFRIGNIKLFGIPLPMKGLVVKGRFFNGNNPSDDTCDEKRRERIFLRKSQNDLKLFREAVTKLGLELGDPDLNID